MKTNKEKIAEMAGSGLTPAEIAAKLGLKPNNVRVVLHSIRNANGSHHQAKAASVTAKTSQTSVQPSMPIGVDDDLAQYIPPAENYIPRKLVDGKTDVELLTELWQKRNDSENPRLPLLVGETGCGKNMLARYVCHKLNLPLIRLNLNGATTPADLLGDYVVNPDQSSHQKYIWVNGWLTRLAKEGGVLMLDELNMCSADFLSCLHSITDKERRLTLNTHLGETIYAHPNFWIIGSINPNGYEGTKIMNEAFRNRFKLIYLPYDASTEKKLGADSKFMDMVEKFRASEDITTPISTRDIVNYRDDCRDFGEKTAMYYFLQKFNTTEQKVVKEIIDLIDSQKTNAAPDGVSA